MNANAPHDAIDQTIDRALSALRDAQPRPGLENRILTSLEHRTAAQQPTRFHLSAHLALWTAASAVLAIASMMILHHRVRAAQNAVILSERSESKNPDNARRATNSEPFSTTNLARPTHTMSSRPGEHAVILSEAPQGRSRRTPVLDRKSTRLNSSHI